MRLIDADIVEKKLHKLALDEWNQGTSTSWSNAYLECEDMVYNAPTVEPIKHGHWKVSPTGWVYCSVCNGEPPEEINVRSKYCPNCGIKMDEVLNVPLRNGKSMMELEMLMDEVEE